MSAQDMRDMLGLSGNVARQPPLKKQKTGEKRTLEKGIAREVSALMGERAPPIALIQVQPKYKQRPRRSHRAAPWEWAGFHNTAREDGLVLHHWQRKHTPKPRPQQDSQQQPNDTEAPTETPQPQEPEQAQEKEKPKDYQYARYNVQVDIPKYDQALYDAQLHDPEWTKEETDYLVGLVGDFGQKWPVVTDRYEFPSKPGQSRSMEDLKLRYYNVSAKVLAHNTPISSMTAPQYNLYSTLTSFNSAQETSRKKLAEGHLYRTQMEVDEENVLLSELQRIMINQQQLENERKEIRDRLEYPSTTNTTTAAQYSTSQQLGQLFQQLLAADRMKKDRRLKSIAEQPGAVANAAQLSSAAAAAAATATAGSSGHRDSVSSAAGRKSGARDSIGGSVSGPSSSSDQQQRALTPHMANRYFVTTHDRINNGVSFASDRLHRARSAKSMIQTDKISAILTHLRIPDIIPLPTQKVIDEFERLMQKVHLLLDMRKVADKEEQEIRVKGAEKGIKEGSAGVKEEGTGDEIKVGTKKRSASVMSEDVQGATKRPKT